MSWVDRLKPAAYTSPSGLRIEWLYENVSKSFDKKSAAFEFPDADGTYVQDLGRSGRRFPLRVIFSGEDYDLRATDFEGMLDESGIGQLEHPLYGRFPVVVFGAVERQDKLVSGANQAIFRIQFFETNELLFPLDVSSPADDTRAAVEEYLNTAPGEFEDAVDLTNTVQSVSLRDRYQAVVDQVETGLSAVAATEDKVKRTFEVVFDSINAAITTFIGDPLALGFQTGVLAQLPSQATASIVDRLESYGSLLSSLTGTLYETGFDAQPANSFRSDDMFASNMVMGAVSSVLNAEFETKTDALAAAQVLLDMADEFTAWRDLNLVSLGVVDTGEVYQQVLEAASIAAGFLVSISFSLKQERVLVLSKPQDPISLEFLLYGTVDVNLDFLIRTNKLVGEEILEIPAGRSVAYYV